MEQFITQYAYAKINLALHIIGRRSDGYHLLDSFVAFADYGDIITLAPAHKTQLTIKGRFAKNLTKGEDNLLWQAYRLMGAHENLSINLDKRLPIGAGIGGGSSDAAACIRGLMDLWQLPPPYDLGLSLGADVPVCFNSTTQRMQGIGECLSPIAVFPELNAVLVNSGISVSTSKIFDCVVNKENASLGRVPDDVMSFEQMIAFLKFTRNDLQDSAISLSPSIGVVLDALRDSGAALARMSGSGGTCFGLYENQAAAQEAADFIENRHSDFWVKSVVLCK